MMCHLPNQRRSRLEPTRAFSAVGTGRRRRRANVPLMFLAAVTVTLTSVTANRAESAGVPDSARIALVRLAVLTHDDIRVLTDTRKLLAHHVVVSPDGLQLPLTSDGLYSSSFSSPPEARLVPWTEIESIDARRSSHGTGALAGAWRGLEIGASIVFIEAAVYAISLDPHRVSGAPIVIGVVGGATLGWLVHRPGPWTNVYP